MITKVFSFCNGLKKVQHCSFLFWNIFADPHRQPRTVANNPNVILVLHLNLNKCVSALQLLRDAVDDVLNIHFSGKGKKSLPLTVTFPQTILPIVSRANISSRGRNKKNVPNLYAKLSYLLFVHKSTSGRKVGDVSPTFCRWWIFMTREGKRPQR